MSAKLPLRSSCWCPSLVGRLAETRGRPGLSLCTRSSVAPSPCALLSTWPCPQGGWTSYVAAQSSQKYKAEVARPSYDLNPEPSQRHFCPLLIRASHRPDRFRKRGLPWGVRWRCGLWGVPSVTHCQNQC